MKFFIKILILIIILFPIKKTFAFVQKKSDFQIIAKVNNEAITKYDLDNRYKLIRLSLKEKKTKISSQLIYKQALEQLIEDKLKEQDISEKKISISEQIVDNYIAGLAKQKKMSKKQLKRYLNRNGINYNVYFKKIKNDLEWGKLLQNNIQPNIVVFDYEVNEAAEYIVKNSDRTRFNISEIFIPISDNESKASTKVFIDELVEDIRKNGNFEEVAGKFSRSPTASNFGNIGWVDEYDISSNIFNKIKSLKKGGISAPLFVDNGGGYYIFKLNNKKRERTIKEEEVARIKSFLYNQKLNISIKKYLDELYNDAFIEYLE